MVIDQKGYDFKQKLNTAVNDSILPAHLTPNMCSILFSLHTGNMNLKWDIFFIRDLISDIEIAETKTEYPFLNNKKWAEEEISCGYCCKIVVHSTESMTSSITTFTFIGIYSKTDNIGCWLSLLSLKNQQTCLKSKLLIFDNFILSTQNFFM